VTARVNIKKCHFLLGKAIGVRVNIVLPLASTEKDVNRISAMVNTRFNIF
jgi:hypothetical protein